MDISLSHTLIAKPITILYNSNNTSQLAMTHTNVSVQGYLNCSPVHNPRQFNTWHLKLICPNHPHNSTGQKRSHQRPKESSCESCQDHGEAGQAGHSLPRVGYNVSICWRSSSCSLSNCSNQFDKLPV